MKLLGVLYIRAVILLIQFKVLFAYITKGILEIDFRYEVDHIMINNFLLNAYY